MKASNLFLRTRKITVGAWNKLDDKVHDTTIGAKVEKLWREFMLHI